MLTQLPETVRFWGRHYSAVLTKRVRAEETTGSGLQGHPSGQWHCEVS
jgi:hypothetical protein